MDRTNVPDCRYSYRVDTRVSEFSVRIVLSFECDRFSWRACHQFVWRASRQLVPGGSDLSVRGAHSLNPHSDRADHE